MTTTWNREDQWLVQRPYVRSGGWDKGQALTSQKPVVAPEGSG